MGSILPETDDVLLQFVYGTVRFMLSIIAFGLASFGLVQAKIAPKEMVIKTWVDPMVDFFHRYGQKAVLLLVLIGLYRISDIIAGNISNIFIKIWALVKPKLPMLSKLWVWLLRLLADLLVAGLPKR